MYSVSMKVVVVSRWCKSCMLVFFCNCNFGVVVDVFVFFSGVVVGKVG